MTSKIPPLIKTVDPQTTQQSESRLSFMSAARRKQSVDVESEIVKDYTYINKLVTQLNSIMQNEDMILSTRVDNLEDEIAKSRQAIIDLRGRIDRVHHLPDLSNKPSARARMDSNANAAATELTVGTTVEYLRNKPIILTNFTEQTPPDEMIDILHRLPDDVKDRFLGYSIVQLDRLVKCVRCYRTLSQSVGSDDFSRHLTETLEELFCSNSVFLFLCDPKTGEFYTKFDHKGVTVSLRKGESVITSVAKTGNVTVYTDPTKAPFYSVSLDPLFNPDNLPVLLVPIEGDAVIMVLCTDKESFMFSTEDQVVGGFFALLLKPLLKDHLRCEDQVKDRELRKLVQSFEREIFSKEKFDQLLPFLNDSFRRHGKASDMRIFIQKDGFLISYDIENGRLVESKHDVIGVPAWVIRTMLHISVDCLSFAETECFDLRIDRWAEGKPFAAFPILETAEKAMAVLCLTRKEKFNHWDFEFFTSVSTTLSLAIPKCLESANTISNEEANASVENLPKVISKFTFENIESETAVTQIAKIISEQTKSEIISVYIRDTATNATKRLVTLRNQEAVDEDMVSDDFVDFVFSSNEPINATDPKRIERFETRSSSLVVRSVMCVVNRTHEDNHIAVIELNSTSTSGQFGVAYHDCVISFSSMIMFSLNVHNQNEVIHEAKKSAVIMELVYKYWSEAVRESEAPMDTMMGLCARMFDASFSALLRFTPLSGGFISFMHSTGSPDSVIHADDPLLLRICESEDVHVIENIVAMESELLKIYRAASGTSVLAIPVNKQQKVYALFVVEKLTKDYSTHAKYIRPVLSTLYRNWRYSDAKARMNKRREISDMVNIFDTNVLATDVVSRIFSVTDYDESQKIEILITMFDKFDLLSTLQTDYEGLMEFLLTARSHYNREIPYHNWDHSIDTTQFVYSCLMRGKMNRFFKPAHIAAILLAALLHDVDHKGVNSTFLINSHSPLVSEYGEESPLEKHHLAIAMKLLKDHLITKDKELYKDITFWQFFASCILSTDMIKHFDYMDKFKQLTLGFNPSNPKEPHLLLVAQMVVKSGNFANCTRPFHVAKSMAENIVKEYEEQGRREEELELQLSGISEAVIMRKQGVAEIELEFLTAVVSPLLKLLGGVIPELADWSIQMEDNKKQWDEVRS